MTKQFPETVAAYIQATNSHDAAAFINLFKDVAVVNDAGREFNGRAAIKEWSEREIFGAQVTLEVLDVADRRGDTVITTRVDGNFDRTGLPDPVIIDQYLTVEDEKIVSLVCRLAGDTRGTE